MVENQDAKVKRLEQEANQEKARIRLEAEKNAKIQAFKAANEDAKKVCRDLIVLAEKGKDCSVEFLKYLLEQFKICEQKLHERLIHLVGKRSHFIDNLRQGTLDIIVRSKVEELNTVKNFIHRLEELLSKQKAQKVEQPEVNQPQGVPKK